MVVEELKKKFETEKEVKFKLYSLEYIIQEEDSKVIIYPLLYSSKKNVYNSFDEVLYNYTIYNESIIDNLDRLIIL